MKTKKFLLLVVSLVLLILVFSFNSVAMAAPQDGQDENGPPVKVVVVVHYPHQADRVFSGIEGGALVEQIGFIYDGLHWQNPSVAYYINLSKQNPAFLNGITGSFAAWDDASGSYQTVYSGSTKSTPGSLQAKWNRKTGSFTGGLNVVGWKNLALYPGAIGVTYIWGYTSSTGDDFLIEVDTALNSSSAFHWWQTAVEDDPDSAVWPTAQISATYDVDVQNIMTHEAGHWLVLGDLYDSIDQYETMYGYAGEYELQKRSLESGDEAGIQSIYGP